MAETAQAQTQAPAQPTEVGKLNTASNGGLLRVGLFVGF